MKKLCRIRLINWHYFVNETINVKGSFLITGENTSGKSTILDALQMILTADTSKFNTAANEKSSRDIRGYVRCKTGIENNIYHRTGSIISFVALEFYETKKNRYFVLGLKIDSHDEESRLIKKWFITEGRFEELSFITDQKPSTSDQFRRNDKKIKLLNTAKEAKVRFAHRMGSLEDRFFDLIPKSLAFKPMNNVKEFINKFILSEKKIEVDSLRNNIKCLKELENLMDLTKNKINFLLEIITKSKGVDAKIKEIKINNILIERAKLESLSIEIKGLDEKKHILASQLIECQETEKILKSKLENIRQRLKNYEISLEQDSSALLIKEIKHKIELMQNNKKALETASLKFKNELDTIVQSLSQLIKIPLFQNSENSMTDLLREIKKLYTPETDLQTKISLICHLKEQIDHLSEKFNADLVRNKDALIQMKKQRGNLEKEIINLKNKKFSYPENTIKLKKAIEAEFEKNGINSPVMIFCELAEINDTKWQDAIEGCLDKHRFDLIVEPGYYKIALQIFEKIKKEIPEAGLVNTIAEASDQNICSCEHPLSLMVTPTNSLALIHIETLLGNIETCSQVSELTKHFHSVTLDCMVYEKNTLKKIDPNICNTPFIGARAYKIQLEKKEKELDLLNNEITATMQKIEALDKITGLLKKCRPDYLEDTVNAPIALKEINHILEEEKKELKKAELNPNYLEITIEINNCKKQINESEKYMRTFTEKIGSIKIQTTLCLKQIDEKKNLFHEMKGKFDLLCSYDDEITEFGIKKFNEQIMQKNPHIIVLNFTPHLRGLENKRDESIQQLSDLQTSYCVEYETDFQKGYACMQEYYDEHHRLNSSEIIKYQDELNQAMANCEQEFRESFLARLKENIETAKREFKELNSALKNIYYGEDSYKFTISKNKNRESLYNMIMSKNNLGGFSIWSDSFFNEYREEIDDLFSKLTAYDDLGENVLKEYTDYRSYLDYDILVEKMDGTKQYFSKIYGEKSGGETQTPYYVAIAASFAQLYRFNDTIRIIIMDEAFDKMDDTRISSMMDFFNKQKFQIILATPPAKMEIIGEKVDTVLVTLRDGSTSVIEEYDFYDHEHE